MLNALLVFLLGALVLLIVLWVAHLLTARMELPSDVRQIVLALVGLIGLVALLILAFGGSVVIVR